MRDRFGEAWDLLFSPPVAHRGLWSPDGAPENSLGAFAAASKAGYGIELDVQLSADGEAMVFHDESLKRMTGVDAKISQFTAAELGAMRLKGADETIPTLAEALALIGRHTLVHVELKTAYGAVGPLEQRVHEVIIDHPGPICVIGFNPYSHAWFADRYPNVLRGLDSYDYASGALADHLLPAQREAFSRLEHVGLARPHFLALHKEMLPHPRASALRAQGMPIVTWTIRDPQEWLALEAHCDNLIFEGFRA